MNSSHEYEWWITQLSIALIGNTLEQDYCEFPSNFAVAIKDQAMQSTSTPAIEAMERYRHYYIKDKSRFATWKAPASTPAWFDAETI
jgi:nitrous oxide reductase accessory protein NosL